MGAAVVFNANMKRFLITAAATAVAMAGLASTAAAAVVELGSTASAVAPPPPCSTTGKTTTCPGGASPGNYAIILTRVTALETLADGVAYPTTVKTAGRLVAFTVGLSALDTNRSMRRSEIHFADVQFGGTTRVAITVVRKVGPAGKRRWKVVAESPVIHVQPYLGQVVQFPLATSLPVLPGDVVALTTPTWVPVLTVNLNRSKFAYRQSRSTSCGSAPSTSVAQAVGQTATYGCNYPSTRLEYSATEVTNPVAVNPVHGRNLATVSSAFSMLALHVRFFAGAAAIW